MPNNNKKIIAELNQAVKDGNLKAVQSIILAHPGYVNTGENTFPLMSAVEAKHKHIVKFLLDNGADVTKQNFFGDKPLDCAYQNKCFEIGELIFNKIQEQLSSLNAEMQSSETKMESDEGEKTKKESYLRQYEGVTPLWLQLFYTEEQTDITWQSQRRDSWWGDLSLKSDSDVEELEQKSSMMSDLFELPSLPSLLSLPQSLPSLDDFPDLALPSATVAESETDRDITDIVKELSITNEFDRAPECGPNSGVTCLLLTALKNRWNVAELILEKSITTVNVAAMAKHDKHPYKDVPFYLLVALKKQWTILRRILQERHVVEIDVNLALDESRYEADSYQYLSGELFNKYNEYRNKESGAPIFLLAGLDREWDLVSDILHRYQDKIVDINATPKDPNNQFNGITILWLAAMAGRWDIVEQILKTYPDADINASPKHDDRVHKNISVLELLIINRQWKLIFLHGLSDEPPMGNLNLIRQIMKERKMSLSFDDIKDLGWGELLKFRYKERSLSDRVLIVNALVYAIFKLTYVAQQKTSELETSELKQLKHLKPIIYMLLEIRENEKGSIESGYEEALREFEVNQDKFTLNNFFNKVIYIVANIVNFIECDSSKPSQSDIDSSSSDAKQIEPRARQSYFFDELAAFSPPEEALNLLDAVKNPSSDDATAYAALSKNIGRQKLTKQFPDGGYRVLFFEAETLALASNAQCFESKAGVQGFVSTIASAYNNKLDEKNKGVIEKNAELRRQISELKAQLAALNPGSSGNDLSEDSSRRSPSPRMF